jgi:hypothetical protein
MGRASRKKRDSRNLEIMRTEQVIKRIVIATLQTEKRHKRLHEMLAHDKGGDEMKQGNYQRQRGYIDLGPEWLWTLVGWCAFIGFLSVLASLGGIAYWLLIHLAWV